VYNIIVFRNIENKPSQITYLPYSGDGYLSVSSVTDVSLESIFV